MPSRLLQIIARLYYWTDDEVSDLATQIEEQMKSAWLDGLRSQASSVGCRNASPRDPSGSDLRDIRTQAREDANSIANTWRRDVDRQLQRLYDRNPRGNRNYYSRNMEIWANQRGAWKNLQISLVNEQVGFNLAQRAFVRNNNLDLQFRYVGTPPVSDDCIRRTAAGLVDEAYVLRNPTPAHVNCPHIWQPVRTGQRVNCEDLWIG